MSKLIFGRGYLGRRVARLWLEAGEPVFAVTRSAQRAGEFEKAGLRPIVADVMQPSSLANLPQADTVLYAVGYDRASGLPMRELYVHGLQNALAALWPGTQKVIYISSTGVYGQSHGEWVDEDSACEPLREGGRACLEAERRLAHDPLGDRAAILRLAGLYGPGRIPNAAEIRAGRPIAAPARGFLNLIHVDDAVAVVLAAEKRARPPVTYVVADGEPVERRAYYQALARLLGAAPPRFAPAPADSPAAQRGASNKRVNSARVLAELETHLQYPSYREGLAAIVAAEIRPPDDP